MKKCNMFFLLVITALCVFTYGNDDALKEFYAKSFPLVQSTNLKKDINYAILEDLNYKNLSNKSRRAQKSPNNMVGFDMNIDENVYVLGTGDGLTIYLWGSINDKIEASIDHEGNFVIPSVGIIQLKGKTLSEGKKLIRSRILKAYKKIQMSITLSTIKEFKAYLLGEVVEPGYYVVNGATRVSDLIAMGDGLLVDSIPKIRGIEIKNESNPIRYADLALFYHYNEIGRNPYLIEGDRVFVSRIKEYISIFGAVNYPGIYDHISGDSLLIVIKAAGGLVRGADSSKIIVTRFVNNTDSLVSFELTFKDSSIYSFILKQDDRILICKIPDYRVHRKVFVNGEVKFPGVYPIQDDKTKLVDVIAMAGGLTENAYLRASKIVRMEFTRVGDREFDRLKKIPLNNLSPLERSYLKTKLTEEGGIVSIDFEELLAKGSDLYNIVLRDGDEITLARNTLSIKVTGAIVTPGLVSFKKDAGFKYYIEQAGGFNTRARKRSVMIIKGGTEMWLKPAKVEKLEAGDAVWVPEKQYRDRLQTTKDVLSLLGAVATIFIAGITIYNFASDTK